MVKSKITYRNKEAEKRSKQFDKKIHKEGESKKTMKDPISEAHKQSKGSPNSMFKKSMSEFNRLLNKKKK